MDEKIICEFCGTENNSSDKFCCKCGGPLHNKEDANPEFEKETFILPDIKKSDDAEYDADIADMIGKKNEYYIKKFSKIKENSSAVSWNWSAFLFTEYWFMYRKMYLYGIIMILLGIVSTAIKMPIANPFVTYGINAIIFIIRILAGLFGNCIYMKKTDKNTEEDKSLNDEDKPLYLKKNGGTNTAAVVITLLAMFALLNLYLFLYNTLFVR